MKLIAAITLLLSWPCAGQQPTLSMTSGGITNCRFWNAMTIPEKMGWLLGYHDGLFTALGLGGGGGVKNGKDMYEGAFPQGLTNIEIALALDRFCGIPENAPLSLLTANTAVAMKARGVPQPKIDEFVSGVLSKAGK